ncbi:SnoaL-like domain-containing protein [Sphingorhabdus arenilitoris]|uniref:SnoaL-like domain-containing protein n=1 Tax=Sphingorhabdus arenilitoris TaxID=1490041 RepID=A0ABV8RH59_9SPHN
MPTTQDIAKDFVQMCKKGQFDEAGEKYWAANVVSLEPMEGEMARAEGLDAVKAKGEWWNNSHEVHSFSAGDPVVNGDQFIVEFEMDVTNKDSGERMQMQEQALYTVADGKIVEERFFYGG